MHETDWRDERAVLDRETELNCSLNTVTGLILGAIAALTSAMGLAYLWLTALPLFAAAALVAAVSLGLIPAIRNALLAYAACRGPGPCSISMSINTLGQAAATLSLIAFALAGAMQVAALGFLFSWFLSWLGVAMQAAVLVLVKSGLFSCGITILILLGVLSNAYAYRSCMDKEGVGPGTVTIR